MWKYQKKGVLRASLYSRHLPSFPPPSSTLQAFYIRHRRACRVSHNPRPTSCCYCPDKQMGLGHPVSKCTKKFFFVFYRTYCRHMNRTPQLTSRPLTGKSQRRRSKRLTVLKTMMAPSYNRLLPTVAPSCNRLLPTVAPSWSIKLAPKRPSLLPLLVGRMLVFF